MKGKFISLEGGEGAGKSTQLPILAHSLRMLGLDVICTREPGGSPGAEAIRDILIGAAADQFDGKAEVLLHYAARHEHVLNTVRPALERGAWVISDRFADSTMVYQGYGLGVDRDWIGRVNAIVLGGLMPDLTLILDILPDDGRDRVLSRARAMDRYDGMELHFHSKVRAGFLAVAEAEPDRCVVINASAPVVTVSDAIRCAVAKKFALDLSGHQK